MNGPSDPQRDLATLRNLIFDAHELLDIELPQGRAIAAREKLTSALALTDLLVSTSPAVSLGRLGGLKTVATQDPDYFRRLAAQRKSNKGGRPKKS